MAKRITIAELNLNSDAFEKSAQRTKIAIDKIKLAQQKLKTQSKENSKEFIRNQAELKRLNSTFNLQKNAINSLKSPYSNLARQLRDSRTKAKDLAAQFGVNSTQAKKAAVNVGVLDRRLKRIDKSVGQSQRNVGNYNSGLKAMALRFVGLSTVIFGAIRAFRAAIGIFTKFEKANATLSAILQVSKDDMVELNREAQRLGATTAKTATEVVGLQIAFARLGFSQNEIINLTEATISGSIAMNAELAQTANLVGAMVNTFTDFSSIDAPEIIDILALSTAKSALNFEKLEKGLPTVAGAANAAGVPFTLLVALLGKLADSGIDTSTSATALRNIFIKSKEAGEDYSEILKRIKGSQDKLTASVSAFGVRAAVSASVLAENIDKTVEFDEVLQKAGGTAKEMSDKELDTLIGEVTLLTSAWQGLVLSIENGNGGLARFLRSIIKTSTGLTGLVQEIGESSTGFIDFFAKLASATTLTGQVQIASNALIRKSLAKTKIAREQLLKLTEDEMKLAGEFEPRIEFERRAIAKLTKTEIDSALKVFETKKSIAKQEAEALKKKQEAEALDAKNKKQKIIDDAAAKKIADEKAAIIKDEKRIKDEDKEKKRIVSFNKEKQDIENEIAILKAETDLEKAILKEEQAYAKHLTDLENDKRTLEQRNALKELYEDEHILRIAKIRSDAAIKEQKAQLKVDKIEETSSRNLANQKIAFQKKVTSVLTGLLGDGLAARIAATIAEAFTGILKLQGIVSAAQTANMSAAVSAGFPQNIPLIAAATLQNTGLSARSKIAQGQLLKTVALKGVVGSFADGGQIPTLRSGTINSGSNIAPLSNGDDTLAYVGQGEVILNREQQARAGGSSFFKSIGVPNFASGGINGISDSVTTRGVIPNNISEDLINKINDIKVIGFVDDVTDLQGIQAEIVSGADV